MTITFSTGPTLFLTAGTLQISKGSQPPISPNNRLNSHTAVTRAQLFIILIALGDLLFVNHTKSIRYWENGYHELPMRKSKRTRSN